MARFIWKMKRIRRELHKRVDILGGIGVVLLMAASALAVTGMNAYGHDADGFTALIVAFGTGIASFYLMTV